MAHRSHDGDRAGWNPLNLARRPTRRVPWLSLGGMAERTNARLLKSREVQASVGSNPTPSANSLSHALLIINASCVRAGAGPRPTTTACHTVDSGHGT